MISSSFDFVVGTDNNVVKGVCSASQSFVNITPTAEMKPKVEITRMEWCSESDVIYFGRSDGVWGKMPFKSAKLEPIGEPFDSSICGLEAIGKDKIVICTEEGSLNSFDLSTSKLTGLSPSPGPNLFAARAHKSSSSQLFFATGGKNNDLKLFDLTSDRKEPVFKAKNLANDWLSLQQPVWIRDLGFIDASAPLPKMVTVTDDGFLRVYDAKVQRRPVVNVSLVDHPLMSLCVFPSSKAPLPLIAAGSGQGWLGLVDLRLPKAVEGKSLPGNCQTKHRLHGRCRGITGSVRAIGCVNRSNGWPLVVAGGLDRFLRVFDSSLPKNGPMAKIYTKSKLTCLAIRPTVDGEKLFGELSLIDNSTPIRKRPKIEAEDEVRHLPDLVIGSDDDDEDDETGSEDSACDEDPDDDSVEYCGSVDLDDFDKRKKASKRR